MASARPDLPLLTPPSTAAAVSEYDIGLVVGVRYDRPGQNMLDTRTLNIIGCGNLGRTLGRLWARQGIFQIGCVLNTTRHSAGAAVAFVGAGVPVATMSVLSPADVVLISTPDDQIERSCEALAAADVLTPGGIVFHCSGAQSSAILRAAADRGASVASVHPIKSFADPLISSRTFAGTFCAVEGCGPAVEILRGAFEAVGGKTFLISADSKLHYHAASVIVCNYLTALMEIGLQVYENAGLDKQAALEIAQPLVQDSVENVFKLGPVRALTGPIARGDYNTVARQVRSLSAWNPQVGELYQRLGAVALDLSRQQGNASPAALDRLDKLLKG